MIVLLYKVKDSKNYCNNYSEISLLSIGSEVKGKGHLTHSCSKVHGRSHLTQPDSKV